MGYYIDITDHNFRIKKEDFQACYQAMCKLNDNDEIKRGGGSFTKSLTSSDPRPDNFNYHPARWFSWMDPNYPETNKTMEDILYALGFENLTYDDEGNLVGFAYSSKAGQEELFLEAMAPFFENGDYITWVGEDYEYYQHVFEDGKMIIKIGRIVFD